MSSTGAPGTSPSARFTLVEAPIGIEPGVWDTTPMGEQQGANGYMVRIRHPNGLVSSFLHLRGPSPLREGQEVTAGTIIGASIFVQPSLVSGQISSTSGVLSGVAGIRVPLGPHLFVRPEVEMAFAGEHLRLSGAAAVGWSWD